MSKTSGIIDQPEDVRLLASPARQEIVDTLEALGGEAPVAAIAAQLGRPSDALYYHLKLLVRGGLLEELSDEGEGRRYRTLAKKGTRLRLRYQPGKTKNARAMVAVAGGMLRTAERDFASAIRDQNVRVEGEARELWASRSKGWVGKRELIEINRALARISALLKKPKSAHRAQLVSVTWVVATIAPKAVRR
jgi:DNA-binding transcriptional ArsR family regulator